MIRKARHTLPKVCAWTKRGTNLPNTNHASPSSAVWTEILTDLHFWIPVIVLFAGLVVLHWIR
jgi:hypothetical protein